MVTHTTLDARGLLCPMPVIKTQNLIQTMPQGERLLILATDPGVLHDIPAWCRVNGHRFISAEEGKSHIEILVEAGSE